jgi:ribosomal protein S18 acetylase RimI-like enzyme
MSATGREPDFVIHEGLECIDFSRVHAWLASSYWSPGITQERVELGARNSALVLGAFDAGSGAQIGFARVVSDKTRFAYLCDVWVDAAARGRGVARALVRYAMEHPEFASIVTWTLGTKDAQGVYEPLGFRDIREPGAYPNTWMVLRKP